MASFPQRKRSDKKRYTVPGSKVRYFLLRSWMIFFLWKAVVNIHIPIKLFYFPHDASYARWSSHSWSLGRQSTGGPSTAPKHWQPKRILKKNSVALFCFKGWYRYVHVSFTYFLEQVQSNFELSWIKDT